MIENNKKIFFALGITILLSGCETGPQRPQRQLTPLEACLQQARNTAGSCTLSALGSGRTFNDAIAQKNVQICEDRQMMQEDRCYARFK